MMKRLREVVKLNIVLLIMLLSVFGAGCGESSSKPQTNAVATGFVKPEVGTYDSMDVGAIILSLDKEKNQCTFYNRKLDKSYTLSYDGTGKIYDKYGSSLVIDQLLPGDVVDVTFIKSKKMINSISKSSDIWVYDDVDDFEIDALTGKIKINGGDYKFTDQLKIFSDNKEAQLIDINGCDTLQISGVDHTVYSVIIEKGHGYLRLKGQDYFEGGWIEIGNKIIKTVTKDMLMAVPVGDYEVKLSNGAYEGNRKVSIAKNQETELDVSDMVVIEEKDEGTVVLVIEPAGAMVYIDGKEVDLSKPIVLEYGIHQLIAKSEGYKTLTQYIKVAQESATLEITMEPSKNKTEIDSSDGASPSPIPEVTTFITQAVLAGEEKNESKVLIESPEKAELYLDSTYVGIVPVSFPKKEGAHVITLRREGYVTRSYTVTFDGIMQNETFSFSPLIEEKVNSESEDVSDNENETSSENEEKVEYGVAAESETNDENESDTEID